MKRVPLLLILVATAFLSVGCGGGYYSGGYYNREYVRVGPPSPRYENYGYAPGPGYVWTPGYYAYRGNNYGWVGGSWVRPPRARARYVPGEWRHHSRGYYWRPGYWR